MNEHNNCWTIEKKDYISKNKELYESIFSLGNGYMGCRGFDEEDDTEEYKLCTYIAGIFDYFLPDTTDMVNTPNFWHTEIFIDGDKFSKGCGKLIEYNKKIDMRSGILSRTVVWENEKGCRTKIETKRFLSISSRHLGVMEIRVTPLNYDGIIDIRTGINGNVKNNIIEDDQTKNNKNLFTFLNDFEKNIDNNGILKLMAKTTQSGFSICEGFDINMYPWDTKYPSENFDCEDVSDDRYIGKTIRINAKENIEYVLDKYVGVWTSRDCNEDLLPGNVVKSIEYAAAEGFESLCKSNVEAWDKVWEISDIKICGDEKTQNAIRYNIFELVQTISPDDSNVSIGARGIMHGRYKGCYFWDTEIFMLPFYEYTDPFAARNLLMYRYNTLDGARKNAENQNLKGARYPWMSSIDGAEQCGTWDIGFSEVHITADIAYAVDRYCTVTGDIDFIGDFGLEMLIETSRYWVSRFTYNESSGKYDMLFVKGPDEYGGVTVNNTYTTIMALNNFKSAMKYIYIIKEKFPDKYKILIDKINFNEVETEKWTDIINRAAVLYDREKKLYIEDENFFRAEPLELSKVKDGDMPLYHKICFDRLQRYRVIKQADIILMMLLMPDEFTSEEKKAAWDTYEPITAHDSSLSFGTHAEAAAKLGLIDEAYNYFTKSVNVDLDNLMNNTGCEGVHFASLGASYQALIHGFCGIQIKDDCLSVNPVFPPQWSEVSFKIYYRNNLISFVINHDEIKAKLLEKGTNKVTIKLRNEIVML